METLGQIAAFFPSAGLLCAALVLDALLPDLPALPRAGKVAARIAATFARRLDRPDRSLRTRQMRGVLVLFLIAGFAGAAAWVIADLAAREPALRTLEILVLIWLLGVRRTWSQLRAAARSAPNDPAREPHRIRRDAIEAAARGFLDQVAGPAVWYLALGLPGAIIYAVAAGLAANLPARPTPQAPDQDGGFAMAFQRLHILMGWVPAWIAAVLIAFAAVLTPHASLRDALREIAAHIRRPVSGAPAAALAGALDLALAGPAPGKAARPWLGRGRARATGTDIGRAAYMYSVACLLMLTGSAILAQFSLAA